jgi:maltose O-acetyltransferase
VRSWLAFQLCMVGIHLVNSIANAVGQDVVSRMIRRAALGLMGVRIGRRSVIDGGGYVYGRQLILGQRCFVNRGCYFDLTAWVVLGDDVEVGHGVTFVTAAHQLGGPARRAGRAAGQPIVVGNGSWIGANATILPGVRIGQGAVVAAGAIVVHDVADNTLVAGVPARTIRDLSTSEQLDRELLGV